MTGVSDEEAYVLARRVSVLAGDERVRRALAAEIEVKYEVSDTAHLIEALRAQGVTLSAPVVQEDQAYAPSAWTPGTSRIGVTFARLRQQGQRCVFTTKTPVDNVLACEEFETEVHDRQQMHHALLAMGYSPTVQVRKTRRTGEAAEFSLCLDEVEGAGTFFEVEAVSEDTGDMAAMQERLASWVDRLGVALRRTGATYDQVVQRSPASR
jgi:adenylate cyclase, class 2